MNIKITDNKKLNYLLPAIEKKIKELFGSKVVKIILYGSFARGDYNSESDVDILVLVDGKDLSRYRKERIKIISEFLTDHDILLSIRITNNSQFLEYKHILPFYKNVLNDGVLLYG